MIRQPKAMIVAGVMSGTSADGVDVALVKVSPGLQDGPPRVKVLGHSGFVYPKTLRAEVLRAMEGEAMTAGDFSRLHWKLGQFYAACVEKACAAGGILGRTHPSDDKTVARMGHPKLVLVERRLGAGGISGRTHPSDDKTVARMGHPELRLVGVHGQTVFHQAKEATWQMGEAAVVRERLGVPVVSDFRPADVAAGGQGAPLVPMLDYCLFRSATKNRVLLNLGGIANFTAIPAGAGLDGLLAFDTGPANMAIDAVMWAEFGKAYDRGGKVASKGKVLKAVVSEVLRDAYFAAPPPKSCGRQQFGAAFVERFRGLVAAAGGSAEDAAATATELTAASVLDAYARFGWPHLGQRAPMARATELVVAGGGVRNAFLMRRLETGFGALRVKVVVSDELGLGAQAKEAAAFALLAWLSWHGLPGNVPSATGAAGARVLGKISW